MKTKKILLTTSGVLKCVVGGGVFLLFMLMLLLSGLLEQSLAESTETLDAFVQGVVQDDPELSFLLEYTPEQIAEYLMGMVNIISIIMVICSLTSITLGVFTLIFARKYEIILAGRLGRKIIFTVLDYIFYLGIIANVLTTVALFLRDKPIEERIIEN